MSVRRWTLIGCLGASLATAAVYCASLRGGFVYDDQWAIPRNAALAHDPAWRFWTDPQTGANPTSGLTRDVYRPLTVLSFALSLKWWGKNLLLWRLENLVWHLFNGFLFALVLRRLGFRWGIGLLFSVAVFLLHPLQVSSVAWLYQRSTLISAAGCLTALFLTLDGPFSVGRLGASLFFLAAALFAKESAISFPFIFWVVSEKKWLLSERRLYVACAGACVGGFLVLRAALLGGWSQIADLPRGWAEKIILTLVALPQYAAKFFVPWGLRASYDLPTLTPLRIGAGLAGALLIGFYFYRLFRQRADGRWVFVLWILCALAPMLPVAPIRAFFAERFMYLGSLGAAALLGTEVDAHRTLRWIAVLWLVVISTVTYRYAGVWVSDATLWAWTVQREPSNAFAHMCLAETLANPKAAEAQYFQALVNHPSAEMALAAWNNLALLALTQGNPQKALYWTTQVLSRRPDAPQALYNRWRALKAMGETGQADKLRRILIHNPQIPRQLLGA